MSIKITETTLYQGVVLSCYHDGMTSIHCPFPLFRGPGPLPDPSLPVYRRRDPLNQARSRPRRAKRKTAARTVNLLIPASGKELLRPVVSTNPRTHSKLKRPTASSSDAVTPEELLAKKELARRLRVSEKKIELGTRLPRVRWGEPCTSTGTRSSDFSSLKKTSPARTPRNATLEITS